MATSLHEGELRYDVAIVGGGLSGLTAQFLLAEAGLKTCLLEASEKPGGRIDSVWNDDHDTVLADLGPTWVWPQYQPTVVRWMQKLGVESFPQYEDGDAVLDLDISEPPQRRFLPGQHGIARLIGGPQSFINSLSKRIPAHDVFCNYPVASIQEQDTELLSSAGGTNHPPIRSKRVIVAAPLRVVSESIDWSGLLNNEFLENMQSTPTWMATQAKVSVLYPSAFWRTAGLSGRVASQIGPLAEVHDHSGPDGVPAALFGFVGWTSQQRREHDLKEAVVQQLVRCFGPRAADFVNLEIRDWYDNDFICARADRDRPPEHPVVLPQSVRQSFCNNRLWFAGAETAEASPGLIDGAFEAGERAAQAVLKSLA